MNITATELLLDLKSRPLKIKIFNLGENLGMDFAYYCHYHTLKNLFPQTYLHLCRSNVDETNTIGFDKFEGRANLPLDKIEMATVKQRYYDTGTETDWTNKLNAGIYDIFPDSFRNIEGYDYIWGIGYGGAPCWARQYPDTTKFISSSVVREAVELYLKEKEEKCIGQLLPLLLPNQDLLRPWERTALEYLVYDKPEYPFTFTEDFKTTVSEKYKDYLRLSLRWPDNTRWYYSIDKQYEVVFNILRQLKAAGKPAKVIYTLKDGEVGNNFNRGQTVDKLRAVQDLCEDCIFTYSWPSNPYRGRISEEQELRNLYGAGIKKICKVDLYQDLLVASRCKVYLSDPGGFTEVASMLRRHQFNSTFLFPTSSQHISTYVTLDKDRKPVRLKVNPIVVDHCYNCEPVLSRPDDPEGYRTIYWKMRFKDDIRQIGENNHGDDWWHFEQAQHTVFKDWYDRTHTDLENAVIENYLRG